MSSQNKYLVIFFCLFSISRSYCISILDDWTIYANAYTSYNILSNGNSAAAF